MADSKFDGKMEPEAKDGFGCVSDAALTSIAISLKRIADALSGDGENIFTRPINCYGEGIGDAIQGQLDRGRR